MKHTPGPWEWVDNKGWFDHDSPDGRLIGATLELLEAL